MKRKGLKPGIKPALDLPADGSHYRRVLKFRRSWIAIVVLLGFDLVFLVPAITTFQQAAEQWAGFNDLFDLVTALFLTAWLLGWSMAPLLLTTVLAVLLFGREVIKVRNGRFVIFAGVPRLGVEFEYAVSGMRNLRIEHPARKSGKSWRGPHLVFDYGANAVAFGSDISEQDLADIREGIEAGSRRMIRHGDATEEELSGNWRAAVKITEPAPSEPSPSRAALATEPLTMGSPSTLALVFANLVPLAGAAFLGWNLSYVMILYWAESAVIGFFNICKIIVIGRWFALLAGPFFAGHFGGFMAVHFLFIYGLFVQGPQDTSGGDLSDVASLFFALWPALAMLFASHAFSFYRNFLGRHEYCGRTVQKQMSEPYHRIIFMHLVVIIGGGLTMLLGESTPVLMVIIVAKIWVDLKAHLRQRAAA